MKNLAEAVLRVQDDLRGISKGSTNNSQGYSYTSVEQMIATVRGPMRQHKLWLAPTAQVFEYATGHQTAPDKRGNTYNVGTCRTQWMLIHAESGESLPLAIDMPAVEGPGRPMDKAASASYSQAITYLMRSVFMLPRGVDEMDVDGRDDSGYGVGESRSTADKGPHPMRPALERAGLTREQWDAWALAHKRTPVAQMDRAQAQAAAAWLNGEGSAVVSGWIQQQGEVARG